MKQRFLAILILVTASGCLGGGKLEVGSMTLDYSGSGNGSHERKTECDTDAQLSGNGAIEDGSLRIEVVDGAGAVVFQRTYDADLEFKTQTLNGDRGEWALRAERRGNDVVGDEFRGRYTFNLVC